MRTILLLLLTVLIECIDPLVIIPVMLLLASP